MSNLDQQTFRDIVNLLIPHCADPASRKSLATTALYGCKVLDRLDFSGNASDYVVHLTTTLLTYGECYKDQLAIIALLEQIKADVGVSQQEQISALIARIPTHTIVTPQEGWQVSENQSGVHVFISYSRENIAEVRRITTDLLNAGMRVWIDQAGLKAGTADWEQALRDAIEEASAILFMASPSSRRSVYVRDELAIALAKNRAIYPIWVAGDERTDCVPMGLGYVQLVDVRGSNYETGLQKLIESLTGKQPANVKLTGLKPTVDMSKPPRNPYKGLRAFQAEDEADFFGRDTLIEDFIETLGNGIKPPRLLAVLGASGSGKSSVIMAGLLPRLQKGAIPGSEDWVYLAPIVPGTYPIESLTITLARLMKEKSQTAINEDLMNRNKRGLHGLVRELSDKPVVLYIDQFEELFTLVSDEAERRQFIDLVTTAITEPSGKLIVILSMRADFYDRPAQYKEFGVLLYENHTLVTPMSLADLYDVVQKPAQQVGLTFDEGLVTEIVFAVREEVAALPLLQFTLDQLYEKRNERILTFKSYKGIGGVQGALAQHAEATFNNLPSEKHKMLARDLFLRLIEPGATEQDATRRRATSNELTLVNDEDTTLMRETANDFIDARLLVSNKSGNERTIEVSHETLIREWQRLSRWLYEKREDLRTLKSLSETVALWKSRNQPVDMLYRGTVLQEAEEWVERNSTSKDELMFISASRQHEEMLRLQAEQQLFEQLTALTDLSTRFAAAVEIDDVIQLTLDALGRFVPYDSFTMWMGADDTMKLVGDRGFNSPLPDNFSFRPADYDIIQETIDSQQVLTITTYSNIPHIGLPDDTLTQSWMGVPLVLRAITIGLLVFTKRDSGHFTTSQEQQIISILASQVVSAIENARLFAETQVSLSETQTLYQLSRQLNEANTLEEVLQGIIITVAPDAVGGQVWLFDEAVASGQSDWVYLSVDLEIVPRTDRANFVGQRYQMSGYPFMAQLSPDEVVFIEDITRLSSVMGGALIQLFTTINARSMVFIPLNIRGVWKGFMSIEFGKPLGFSEEERRIYNALIGQAGVAIDNCLLLQQTENALSRQERLYAGSRIINTAQRLHDLVYAALMTSDDPRLDFWLGLAEGDLDVLGWFTRVRIIAKSVGGSVIETNEIRHMVVAENSPMRRREPEVLADLGADIDNTTVTPSVAEMRNMGQRFMAIFPLFNENTPIAFFYMVAVEDYTLSDDNYDVYKALSGQMSIQIQNRRLLERTEEALNETRRLYVATRAISGAQNTHAVYDAMAGHVAMPFVQHRIGQSPDEALNINISITLLLAHPESSLDAPYLRYEYQWHSDPKRPLPIATNTLIPHDQIPFGMLIHANDDGMLVYRNLATETPSHLTMLYEILSQHDATSAAVAPLWSRQRWFGLIILRSSQSDLLDETYLRFLQAIADQVAIAIENQDLQRESDLERQRLSTILSTLPTGVLVLDADTLKPQQHNERVEELLGQLVKYDEPFTTSAYNIYRSGTNLFYPDAELPHYVVQTEQSQVQADDLAIFHDTNQIDLLMTAAPIFNNNEMVAIVTVFQDITKLRSMENAMQDNLRETVRLYETQRILNESTTLDELLDNIIIPLAMQEPTDAYIILNNEKNNSLQLARFLMQPLENANALYPILTNKLLNINDVQRASNMDEATRKVLVAVDARSVMVLPLLSKSRQQPMGWILIVAAEPEVFTSEQERMMTTISDLASAALDNSLLITDLRETIKKLQEGGNNYLPQ
jgi:GAF domain-containing protein